MKTGMKKIKLLLFYLMISLKGIAIENPKNQEIEEKDLVLNLTNAISRALNDNRQLMRVIDGVTTADYGIELANNEFNIQWSPNSRAGYVGGGHAGTGWSVGGGLDISKKFTTGTEITVGPSILKFPNHYHTEIKAIISQPLLRGLGKEYQLSGILAAQFAKRTACRQLYMAQVKLIIRTVQTLYEVVKAEKNLSLHQESYERIRQFYQAAILKEKLGLSDALDVYRAETELRFSEDGLKGAEERLQGVEDILRELLALPLDAKIKVDVPLIYTFNSLELDKAIQLALENRIEVDQDEDQWSENKRLTRMAKNNLYPELNLVFNYSNCGRDEIFTRACTRHRESTWGIGFTTASNFDPLAEKIAYEQSLMAVSDIARGVEDTEASLIIDVKRAFRHLNRAYQRIHLQEDQMKTSQGELSLAKLKFDRGMADNFNVMQAEKKLKRAQQTYWEAILDHIVGEFQLLAAIGLLIDKPYIP